MREFKQCVEREEIVFNVQVKDPSAPVTFAINGEDVVPDGERVEVKDLGDGKHQLVIHNAKMEDMGNVVAKTPSNKGDEVVESKSAFTVVKGEEAPKMEHVPKGTPEDQPGERAGSCLPPGRRSPTSRRRSPPG